MFLEAIINQNSIHIVDYSVEGSKLMSSDSNSIDKISEDIKVNCDKYIMVSGK